MHCNNIKSNEHTVYFLWTPASYRAQSTHLWGGEVWEVRELKEIGSDYLLLKTERTQTETVKNKIIVMKTSDHQPWRDACLPPLWGLRSKRDTPTRSTVLLTSLARCGWISRSSEHSQVPWNLVGNWLESTKGYKLSHSKLPIPWYLILALHLPRDNPYFLFYSFCIYL